MSSCGDCTQNAAAECYQYIASCSRYKSCFDSLCGSVCGGYPCSSGGSTGSTSGDSTSSDSSSSSEEGLSGGAIFGIIAGIVALLAIITGLLCQSSKKKKDKLTSVFPPSQTDDISAALENQPLDQKPLDMARMKILEAQMGNPPDLDLQAKTAHMNTFVAVEIAKSKLYKNYKNPDLFDMITTYNNENNEMVINTDDKKLKDYGLQKDQLINYKEDLDNLVKYRYGWFAAIKKAIIDALRSAEQQLLNKEDIIKKIKDIKEMIIAMKERTTFHIIFSDSAVDLFTPESLFENGSFSEKIMKDTISKMLNMPSGCTDVVFAY